MEARRPRRWRAATWAWVAALLPFAAHAQAAPGGLTLDDALRSAAGRGAPVLVARERLAASRGGARAAAGAFDTQLHTFVGSSRTAVLGFDGEGAPAVEPSHTTGVTYGASLSRRLRSGVTLGPEIRATRTEADPYVESRNNTASVALELQLPVLRGRGAANTAPERAAWSGVHAAGEALTHAAAGSALDAAAAYWGYVAARERLEVQRQAEARAGRLVAETRALIAAEERPAADLNQVLATLAFREAARIAAEQELLAAREGLGVAMGLDGAEAAALPLPATPFPEPREGNLPAAELDALVSQALARRADLRAARHAGEGAWILARAAGDGLRPRLDVTMGVGYTGAEPGRDWSRMVTPFYRTFSGWTATVEVAWQAAASNALARGDAEQARAAGRLREVELADLQRRIRSGVVVAAEAIRHGRLELERSEAAVRLYRTAVENEERKFGLGMSTLFDVLQAEDALTSALQSQIAAQARYATALARLAYETGTLVETEEEVLGPE